MERGCSTVVCLFIFTTVQFHLWAAIHAANVEVDALIALKKALSDPDNVLQSWNPNLVNPCTWSHIDCGDDSVINPKVQSLYLGKLNLAGPLVSNLADLKSLQYLELFGNQINGAIPKEFGNLTSLVSLDLYNNSLSGSIPRELGNLANLKFIRLNDNQLTGNVPEELKNPPNLKVVLLNDNKLTGKLPEAIENIIPNIVFNISNNPGMCGENTDNPSCP